MASGERPREGDGWALGQAISNIKLPSNYFIPRRSFLPATRMTVSNCTPICWISVPCIIVLGLCIFSNKSTCQRSLINSLLTLPVGLGSGKGNPPVAVAVLVRSLEASIWRIRTLRAMGTRRMGMVMMLAFNDGQSIAKGGDSQEGEVELHLGRTWRFLVTVLRQVY